MTTRISSTTIEFHRFGHEPGALTADSKYIRTCGYQTAADEVALQMEPRRIRTSLNRLRYRADRTIEKQNAAKQDLAAEAQSFLPLARLMNDHSESLHQIDIVTHASELRAFPFEAIYAGVERDHLASNEAGLILTRRIRSESSFSEATWPVKPSVLFVHARIDRDLEQDLIEQHRTALISALEPWGDGEVLREDKRLVVREIDSIEALKQVREEGAFTYIHVLAHGARVPDDDLEESDWEWGLRLGNADSEAVSPADLADVLQLIDGFPKVVTLAACDSGTSARTDLGNSSLAERLHRNGISVVVASQLPLTKSGSVTLTREFYRPLVNGDDVRLALHTARVALRTDASEADERHHDWLSLVSYVRLTPDEYARHLRAIRLRLPLVLLEAIRGRVLSVTAQALTTPAAFERLAAELGERIANLANGDTDAEGSERAAFEAERVGLLASANKSLAELRFVQAQRFPDSSDPSGREVRAGLERSLHWYSKMFVHNPSLHWHGIQKLALEAALNGRLDDAMDLLIVRRIAQAACDADKAEYWAFGSLAEAHLLGALTPEGFDTKAAQHALSELRRRAARSPKDQGFAVESTRRQLQRYVSWWTQENGYFPGLASDLSAQARELVQFLDDQRSKS